jgi:hypothetical protein
MNPTSPPAPKSCLLRGHLSTWRSPCALLFLIGASSALAGCDHQYVPTSTTSARVEHHCVRHLPFDLVFSALDANGLPLNPEWAWQCAFHHTGALRIAEYPDPHAICQEFKYAEAQGIVIGPGCTEQISELDIPDESVPQWYFICHLHESPPWLPLETDLYVHGHVDWRPVTVTGRVSFESPGGALSDRDTNLALVPGSPSLAQVAAKSSPLATPANLAVSASQEETAPLHLEFAYPEVEAALDEASAWWKGRLASLNGAPASVIGLLGLDNRHDSKAELHPVFGMAAREPGGDTQAEPWLVMWRNTGDQGGCSSHDPSRHQLVTRANELTLEVPAPFSKASGVRLASAHLWREGSQVAPGGEPSATLSSDHTRALLSVRLGDPAAEPVVVGEVSLAWLPAPGARMPFPALAAAIPLKHTTAPSRNGDLHDADKLLVELRSRLPANALHLLSRTLHGRAAPDAPYRTCEAIGSEQARSLRRDRSAMELVEAVLDCSGRYPRRVPRASQKHAVRHPRLLTRPPGHKQ